MSTTTEEYAVAQWRTKVLLSCGCPRCTRAWRDDDLPSGACENGKAWIAETADMRPYEILALGRQRGLWL